MPFNYIPVEIDEKYEVHNFRHAIAILKQDFLSEYQDIVDLLNSFELIASDILAPGGRKSPIAQKLDSFLYERNWEEKTFSTKKIIDNHSLNTPTHKIDCYKNKIGVEIEWNNKDPFYDRDLNNFRLLHELGAISVGVIITRADELQKIFKQLNKGSSYGASTTHMSKLLPRIFGNAAGGCPILVIGITCKNYKNDLTKG